MSKNSLIILGLILVLIVAGSVVAIGQLSNAVTVDIKTNGSEVTVSTSTGLFGHAPTAMEEKIVQYCSEVIKDPDSTVESIKNKVTDITQEYNYNNVKVNIKSQFGENQLPMPAVVSGNSMYPTLKDGQELMVLKTDNFKVGDIVISKHPEYDLIVKRVGKIQGDKVYLISDNKEVKTTYEGNYIITETPLNTWVPKSYIVGVVEDY
ncbi:S24/S26 family peptidase [Methanobacterium alcaliphilum]|uniref:S24/S26 family peptidase n=1 Tax=Methanobacterium alcaliphilum TaxID=392018 RepID=UPI00200B643D|nr:S24/S26 family peptidase [Methanobacterium alcaliphilum]MCK9151728.1 S24/S26 family peptidase [Methanobacterium alcaliphilum]